ncbi:flagellar hook protein FlgE [Beijerinckia indica]|uniref:Flagellar hook protein FlgE n=1 Tax=Beijerinckia indica subsp. indica (strain ATCC 9039 / DSM 1715 / NCIMB 8712) TaxID=395963 RepID=B2IG40_BEII9|nr:flagellar hook protein FlgE [Beijerinckia indica]ACB97114.1 flagellar basal body FlaE domain protein [Beijerinckia indica subsp. indica ATCC 9039]
MSLYSALTASVSGMAAQSNKLSAVSDNIANSNTTGYKQADTEFETLVNGLNKTSYDAGGVKTTIRYNISSQGQLTSTSSATDLGIQGNGFFVVTDDSGTKYLTRAGSFTKNADGTLSNTAGYKLMGYNLTSGSASSADGLGGLEVVDLTSAGLQAAPSTSGTLAVNLPSNGNAITTALPSANSATSTYNSKTSLVTYDNLGNAVTLDMYFAKTGTNSWEMSIYNAADAAAGGGFPYATSALSTQTLTFSPSDGSLTTPTSASFTIPNGQAFTLDLSQTTQLAAGFSVSAQNANGNAPSGLKSISIGTDGVLSKVYQNGTTVAAYKIPLATVASVDNLMVGTGNVYEANGDSGSIIIGDAGTNGLGSIQSSQLESSNVDLAAQLTDMIVAQRGYEANSKVFETGSTLLTELVNLVK